MLRILSVFLVLLILVGCEKKNDTNQTGEIALVSIEIKAERPSMKITTTQSLSAIARYSDNTTLNTLSSVEWIVADNNILTVDSNGKLSALKIGSTTIKAKIDNTESNSINITVHSDDAAAPVITLNGDSNITLPPYFRYEELGATATDTRDGNISVVISNNIDITKEGVYTATYRATDKAGNRSLKYRTVTVQLPPETILSNVQFPIIPGDMIYVSVNPFGEGSYSSDRGGIDFDSDRNMTDNTTFSYFPKSDENLIITAIPKDSTRIKTWMGCDSISKDNTQCTVSLKSSNEITPIFEYKEFIVVDNLFDMSGVTEMTYDWNETTQLDGNGTAVMTIENNSTLINIVEGIVVGDYINYSNPTRCFLRKVVSIEKIADNKYRFVSVDVPLNEVIEQGTIFIQQAITKTAMEKSNRSPLPLKKIAMEKSNRSPSPLKKIAPDVSIGDSVGGSGEASGTGWSTGGSADISGTFGLGITIAGFQVRASTVGLSSKSELSFKANTVVSFKKKIKIKRYRKMLSAGRIFAGPFVLIPHLKAEVKLIADGSMPLDMGKATAYAGASGEFAVGHTYNQVTGGRNYSTSSSSHYKGGDITTRGHLSVGLTIRVGFALNGYVVPLLGMGKIYGEIGIGLDPYVKVEAKCDKCFGKEVGNIGIKGYGYGTVGVGVSLIPFEYDSKKKDEPITKLRNYMNRKGKMEADISATAKFDLFDANYQFYNNPFPFCETPTPDVGAPSSGLFTASASWGNPAAELTISNGLMSEQGKTCTSHSIGSGGLTLYGVYPGHYAVNVSAGDTKYVSSEEMPDSVGISISVPGKSTSMSAYVSHKNDYSLGQVADIYI